MTVFQNFGQAILSALGHALDLPWHFGCDFCGRHCTWGDIQHKHWQS